MRRKICFFAVVCKHFKVANGPYYRSILKILSNHVQGRYTSPCQNRTQVPDSHRVQFSLTIAERSCTIFLQDDQIQWCHLVWTDLINSVRSFESISCLSNILAFCPAWYGDACVKDDTCFLVLLGSFPTSAEPKWLSHMF